MGKVQSDSKSTILGNEFAYKNITSKKKLTSGGFSEVFLVQLKTKKLKFIMK